MDNRSIGVFDSGLGGLTVVKELSLLLPKENIIYFGDTGRVPYGTRSRETILKYARQDIDLLASMDVKMIIAACGTVSAVMGDSLSKGMDRPCTGVLLPAAQAAAALSATGRIGVIGTPATVRSGAYGKAIRSIRPEAKVIGRDCPLFVPLVENGYIQPDNQVTHLVAEQYLATFANEDIDTLILGCTHYPLIRDIIAAHVGSDVTLIDPGYETAKYAANLLIRSNMLREEGEGSEKYYVSDNPEGFSTVAAQFLRREVRSDVVKIDPENPAALKGIR